MLDQALCPVSAFYEVAADKFSDTSFRAQVPDKFSLIDGHKTIDPNDEDRIALAGRDGTWFKATWELYLLRQKYRKTLARWWSDTGGGGSEVKNFQNYCQIREKWLTYVYMLYVEASLLLASNASLAVPKELLNKSGYQQQAAHLGCPSNSTTKQLNGAALIQAMRNAARNSIELPTSWLHWWRKNGCFQQCHVNAVNVVINSSFHPQEAKFGGIP